MGEFIRECLAKGYENAMTGDIPYSVIEYLTLTIEEVLAEEEVFSDKLLDEYNDYRSLFESLFEYSGPSDRDIMQGAVDEWEDGLAEIVLKDAFYGMDNSRFLYTWNEFKETVKHNNRFFDMRDNISREKMLDIFNALFIDMEETIPKDFKLYRGRLLTKNISNTDNQDIILECGPPPPKISTSLRMNPAGISYFYGAEDVETCKKEIQYECKNRILLGTFKTKRPLKLINLGKELSVTMVSIFSNKYDHEMNWAQHFLDSFIHEVSKPISKKESEIEYIPTQIISEYIRLKGYDGVIYKSSLTGKDNYTLFCGREKDNYFNYFGKNNSNTPSFIEWLELDDYEIES